MRNIPGWRLPSEPAALARDEIELRMRALRAHVPGVRALAAERAMRADHDLDFVDDIRLVVDEVCAIMLANCTSADTVTIRLALDETGVVIESWVPLAAQPTVGGLSLRVLDALAHQLEHWVDDEDGERVFRLRFCRSRAVQSD